MKVKDLMIGDLVIHLMIGDWVIRKSVPEEPMCVCDIKASAGIVYLDQDGCGVTEKIENIEPISLTKEILYKNGFEGDVYLWINVGDEKTLEYYPFEHRLSLWYGKEKNQEILFKCHCFYVHEFQHALKMCGIEKEIVL